MSNFTLLKILIRVLKELLELLEKLLDDENEKAAAPKKS